ncbi:unnamed protein product [Soboliphyme baturini]|uniref:Nbas_N domain-containing protein n=1 Tax=Soboliphyme baturini TaxID=241478 RepID=A0A183II60_9BILA|nr:unnamed protein product [Soboliphyme baturini]
MGFLRSSKLLAVLQNGELEIRHVRIKSSCVKCRMLVDTHPRWCKILWNRNGTLLISVRSTPVIDVLDSYGNYCYSIKMMFSLRSDKLYTLQHCGVFRAYGIGHLNGYENLFTVDLSNFEYGFFTTLLVDTERNLALSSQAFCYNGSDDTSETLCNGTGIGLRLWRMIDSPPFLIPFDVVSQTQELIINDTSGSVFVQSVDADTTAMDHRRAKFHSCVSASAHQPRHSFFLEWMTSMFFGFAAEDVSKTACTITYTLWELVELTAEELLQKKLSKKDYEGAMAVAKQFHITTDVIYKDLWRHSSIGKNSIKWFLSNITDDRWVLNECLIRVCAEYADNYNLLIFGINLATKHINEGREYEEARRILLKYLHTLQDYGEIIAVPTNQWPTFHSRDYKYLRSKDPLSIAVHFARESNVVGVKTMLLRHKPFLYPYWLYILNNIPETAMIRSYQHLLPNDKDLVTTWAFKPHPLSEALDDLTSFPPDEFCEESKVAQAAESFEYRIVLDWYEFRAIEIEVLTFLPERSVEFLQFAIENGFETKQSEFVERFWNVMLPYIYFYSKHFDVSQEQLLTEFFVSVSEWSLGCVAAVFSSQRALDEKLFQEMTVSNEVYLLDRCFSAVKGEMDFAACRELLDVTSRKAERSDNSNAGSRYLCELDRLIKAMQLLDVTVDVRLVYSEFRDIRLDDAKSASFLKSLIRLLLKKGGYKQEQLFQMLTVLSHRKCICISLADSLKIYAQVLLESKDSSLIQSMSGLMRSADFSLLVSNDNLCEIISNVVLTYINEAESCFDSVLQYAIEVLAVLDASCHSAELNYQQRFLNALTCLNVLKIKERPRRLIRNRSVLQSNWLETIFACDRAYEHCNEILDAVHILAPDEFASVMPLAVLKCAEQSYGVANLKACHSFCQKIVLSNFAPGWKICSELGMRKEMSSSDATQMLCFALLHCNSRNISSLIKNITVRQVESNASLCPSRNMLRGVDVTPSSTPSMRPFIEDLFTKTSVDLIIATMSARLFFDKYTASTNRIESDGLLAHLSAASIPQDLRYALACVLCIADGSQASTVFESAPGSLELAQCAVLYYMLRSVDKKYLAGWLNGDSLSTTTHSLTSPSQVEDTDSIRRWSLVYRRYLRDIIMTILPEGVNKKSFFCSVDYCRDTIIGMAL